MKVLVTVVGLALVVVACLQLGGYWRTWARARPSMFAYTVRNFEPYRYLGLGLILLGLATDWFFPTAGAIHAVGAAALIVGIVLTALSLIYVPLFLSPPWYRRWYRRGGRKGNSVSLADSPHEARR
jgi:hypothetical protein